MESSKKIPIKAIRYDYFSLNEIRTLLENDQLPYIKTALNQCQSTLEQLLGKEDFFAHQEMEEALIATTQIKGILQAMHSVSNNKMGVLTEEMLFKTPLDQKAYHQNATIEKPPLKDFNFLLHLRPHHRNNDNSACNFKEPSQQKSIALPVFFEKSAYDALPDKISAEDLIHHRDHFSPSILDKSSFKEALKTLYTIADDPALRENQDCEHFMRHLDALQLHTDISAIPKLLQKNPVKIGMS